MNRPFGLIILGTFLLSGCFREYSEFWDSKNISPQFSREEKPFQDGEVIVLPSKNELKRLIDRIDQAKETLWIETYTWTEKETQNAVIRAKKRGVDVRVLLEGRVFGSPKINFPTIDRLRKADIPVKTTNPDFTFTHMKIWKIDELWCLSTGNWALSTFTKNREFIFCSKDASFSTSLDEIFLSDFDHQFPIFQKNPLDARLGLAPVQLRDNLTKAISGAKNEIIVYNQSITDDEILNLLEKKSISGVHVELCQANTSNKISRIPYFIAKKPYLHAKVLFIDGSTVLLGSANLTQNALDNNRELMVKIQNNPKLYQFIKDFYNIDCKRQ